MFWRDLDQRVCEHLSAATQEAVLIAPFIKASALTRLLAALSPGVNVHTFTRWRVDEVAAGVSDLSVLDLIEARPKSELHLCDELHAKVYLVDGVAALLGSANVTAAALGLSARPNFEVLEATILSLSTARLFMADLEARSRRATRHEAESIRICAEALHAKLPPEAAVPPDGQTEGPIETARTWVPNFRSPDRLYSLARDDDWIKRATVSEPAFRDLIALVPPIESGEPAFDSHVRAALMTSSLVADLERFLAEPQRFGALTEWLRNVLPNATHKDRQATGQTLIRWLIYFAPDRFEVGVPGAYSEVLSVRQG